MITHKLSLLELAAYYEKALTDEQLRIYSEQLFEYLSESEVRSAVKLYVSNPENEFFPRPISKLISLVKEPLNVQDLSQQAAALIKQAVVDRQSFWTQGYFWGKHPETGEDLFYYEGKTKTHWTWREAAEEYFGSLGLAIVDHMGGWHKVCERFNESPDTVVWPQLLKSGESVQTIYRHEKENTLPALPERSKDVLRLVSIKEIPGDHHDKT